MTAKRLSAMIGVLAIGFLAAGGLLLVFWHAPVAFGLAGVFALPLLTAGALLGSGWVYLAVHGRARLVPHPRRPGRLEPRPFSAAQRRRPRT